MVYDNAWARCLKLHKNRCFKLVVKFVFCVQNQNSVIHQFDVGNYMYDNVILFQGRVLSEQST